MRSRACTMANPGFFSDMDGLFQFTHELMEDRGARSCYALQLTDRVVRADDCMLLKVNILDAATMSFSHYGTNVMPQAVRPPKGVVLLRASFDQYETLLRHVTEVRVMQAHVHVQDHAYILDATAMPTFLAGHVPLRLGETLQVAELFSGAFMGWSRAAWMVRECGIPCHTSWFLDVDGSCAEPLSFWHPDVEVARAVEDIPVSAQPTASVFLQASWDESWWKASFALRPVHLACISPPCQPWSTASTGSGLQSRDGLLILKAVSLLGAVQVPLVALEEVSGFATHPHFAVVMKHINDVGYQCVWRRSLQLSEVGPVARKRFFMLLKHITHPDPCPSHLQGVVWKSRSFPSFADLGAHFQHLPADLLQPCLLQPEVLSQYLDPELFPRSRTGRPRADPFAYRVRQPTEQAECFMASYHRQHCLPSWLLQSKGLLCSLLATDQGPRFYSAPEIACAHGAVWCHFISGRDQDAMRHLGNCLAVQQAVMVVSLATQCFQAMPRLDPALAVAAACDEALASHNSLLVPVARGWLLCCEEALTSFLCRRPLRAQVLDATRLAPHRCHCLVLRHCPVDSSTSSCLAFADQSLPLCALLDALGLLPGSLPADQDVISVWLPDPQACALQLLSCDVRPAQAGSFVRLLGPDRAWLVAKGRSDTYCQTAAAFWAFAGWEVCDTACFDVYGGRVHRLRDLPRACIVAPGAEGLLCGTFLLERSALEACSGVNTDRGILLEVKGRYASDWWLTWPGHLLQPLGAHWQFDNFPTPESENLLIDIVFEPGPLHLAREDFPQWFRTLLFLGVLRDEVEVARRRFEPLVLVEVQICTLSVYVGVLPARLTFAFLEGLWRLACEVTCLPSSARVFSGVHPVAQGVSLGALLAGASRFHVRHGTRRLLLTVFPSARGGGGTKDEVMSAVRSKLAQTCLEQGCALQEVTRAVNQLVGKTALSKLQEALRLDSVPDRWLHLQALFQAQGVRAPASDEAANRAARRIQAAARRKRLFHKEVCAADFKLAGNFFVLEGGSPAPVLTSLVPGATGVLLVDLPDAQRMLRDFAGKTFTELALVCIGPVCPDGDSCHGSINFPAWSQNGEGHVLLSGCYHNLGARAVRPKLRDPAQVPVEDTVHCGFQVFRDEWPDEVEWQNLCKNPVRTVVDAFKASGFPAPLAQPWARTFRTQHGPAAPSSCDQVQFSAKVSQSDLPGMLKTSGHNAIYLTPRAWDGSLHADWSVVWVSEDRSHVARAALGMEHQAGLVRSRTRFGVRFANAHFDVAFRALRPAQAVPERVSVQHLYKISPLPHGATESAIVEWGRGLQWKIKVLKSLGPQQWLIGSASPPPDGWIGFNGAAILILPIQSRSSAPRVVKAGHKALEGPASAPATTQEAPVDSSAKSTEVDPWTAYLRQKGRLPAASAPAPSAVSGNTLQQHDRRLQALETTLEEVRAAQVSQQAQYLSDKQAMSRDLQAMSQQFAQSVDSLHRAQQQQQEQMRLGVEELKSLVLSSKSSQDSPKRAKRDNPGVDSDGRPA